MPALSAFAAQAGELTSGLVLLTFFAVGRRFAGAVGDAVFYLTKLLIGVIMLFAVYLHRHPDVPAETLPFQSKPPAVTIIVLLLAGLNSCLHRKNRCSKAYSKLEPLNLD